MNLYISVTIKAIAVLQNLGAPEAGPSMRSGRISKLTQRFSQYKSQGCEAKGIDSSHKMIECDAELADVVEALCDLGQQSVNSGD